jgi:hypothetical protein
MTEPKFLLHVECEGAQALGKLLEATAEGGITILGDSIKVQQQMTIEHQHHEHHHHEEAEPVVRLNGPATSTRVTVTRDGKKTLRQVFDKIFSGPAKVMDVKEIKRLFEEQDFSKGSADAELWRGIHKYKSVVRVGPGLYIRADISKAERSAAIDAYNSAVE